jgi:hypothetical protein
MMSYIGAKCPLFGGIKIKAHQLYMVSALGLGDVGDECHCYVVYR